MSRCIQPSLLRHQDGDDSAVFAAVDAEVMVEGEDAVAVALVDHGDEAGVGEGHGEVGVLLHEGEGRLPVGGQVEVDEEQAAFKPGCKAANAIRVAFPQKKTGFGQDSFAGNQRGSQFRHLCGYPRVVGFPSVEVGDQGACIYEGAWGQRPKPSMCLGLVARSFTPLSMQPQSSWVSAYMEGSSSIRPSGVSSRSTLSLTRADLDLPRRLARFSRRRASSSGNLTVMVFINRESNTLCNN